ncbi:MAG: hypothetical protein V4557_15015 [Bacteroidota bacterium]
MKFPTALWLKLSFFNLVLIALIGVLMRYKIAFSFPFLDQKHLLHGHSHFAFAGWITHTLMVLLISVIADKSEKFSYPKYRILLYANLVTAYGMLISFTIQGYGFLSIAFSTLSIFVSYAFAIIYWKDLNRSSSPVSHLPFKAALVLNVLSSIGPFTLAFMMATKNIHQSWYLASVYYFLHFQYNGWFFFAILGLVFSKIEHLVFLRNRLLKIYRYFITACIPAYFLSALWLPIPLWLYWLVVAAAVAQIIAWFSFTRLCRRHKHELSQVFQKPGRGLLLLAAIALTIKLLLQLGSTVPSLSQLAFGFRPIVIGYLHLVLLGVVSIFLLGYIISFQLVTVNKKLLTGIYIFLAGVILNEFLLMIQGVTSLYYISTPYISEALFATALILFVGASWTFLTTRKRNISETDFNHNFQGNTNRAL